MKGGLVGGWAGLFGRPTLGSAGQECPAYRFLTNTELLRGGNGRMVTWSHGQAGRRAFDHLTIRPFPPLTPAGRRAILSLAGERESGGSKMKCPKCSEE